MESIRGLKVNVNLLSPEFVDIRMDKQRCKDSYSIFAKLMKHHISYLIRLQVDEINIDFPDEMPKALQFTGPKKTPSKPEKKVDALDVEAKEYLGDEPIGRERKSRYSGSYRAELPVQEARKRIPKSKLRHKCRREDSQSSVASSTLMSSSLYTASMKMTIKNIGSSAKAKSMLETSSSASSDSSSSSDSEPEQAGPSKIISIKPNTEQSKNSLQMKQQERPHRIDTNGLSPTQNILKQMINCSQVCQPEVVVPAQAQMSSHALQPKQTGKVQLGSREKLVPGQQKPQTSVGHKKTSMLGQPAAKKFAKSLSSSSSENESINPLLEMTSTKKVNSKSVMVNKLPNSIVSNQPIKENAKTMPKVMKDIPTGSTQKPVESKNYKIPPLIEPPKMNPKTTKIITKPVVQSKKPNAVVKTKRATSGRQSLGGIFAIDNGWEKTAAEVKKPVQEFTIPKINQKPTRICYQQQTNSAQVFAATKIPVSMDTSQGKHRSKFDRRSEESGSESGEDDIVQPLPSKSMFTDSEAESEDVPPTTVDSPLAKRQKLQSKKDDEHNQAAVPSNGHARNDDDDSENDDRISIEADLDYFDDDFDNEPVVKQSVLTRKKILAAQPKAKSQQIAPPPEISYTAELDDLKMKVRKEIVMDQMEEAKAEFDRNTRAIMLNAPKLVDQVGHRVFYKFFHGSCVDFFDSICLTPDCPRKHFLPEYGAVRTELEKASVKDIDEVYDVCIKIPKMFEQFFLLFAEIIIKKVPNFESRLARMVMECEKNPRSHQKYSEVVDALVQFNKMPRYKAIKWLIGHHTDSTHAQETILSMVVETGPDLIRLMDYVNDVSRKRTMPNKIIEKMALNVTTYQDPIAPHFVLNNLFQLPIEQLRLFDRQILVNFLKFQMMQNTLSSPAKLHEFEKKVARLNYS